MLDIGILIIYNDATHSYVFITLPFSGIKFKTLSQS